MNILDNARMTWIEHVCFGLFNSKFMYVLLRLSIVWDLDKKGYPELYCPEKNILVLACVITYSWKECKSM
jgi:hypothetical protein